MRMCQYILQSQQRSPLLLLQRDTLPPAPQGRACAANILTTVHHQQGEDAVSLAAA